MVPGAAEARIRRNVRGVEVPKPPPHLHDWIHTELLRPGHAACATGFVGVGARGGGDPARGAKPRPPGARYVHFRSEVGRALRSRTSSRNTFPRRAPSGMGGFDGRSEAPHVVVAGSPRTRSATPAGNAGGPQIVADARPATWPTRRSRANLAQDSRCELPAGARARAQRETRDRLRRSDASRTLPSGYAQALVQEVRRGPHRSPRSRVDAKKGDKASRIRPDARAGRVRPRVGAPFAEDSAEGSA
jgi:hypothetical protein